MYCAGAACIAFALYYSMQPTQLANPGLAAYNPPPRTVITCAEPLNAAGAAATARTFGELRLPAVVRGLSAHVLKTAKLPQNRARWNANQPARRDCRARKSAWIERLFYCWPFGDWFAPPPDGAGAGKNRLEVGSTRTNAPAGSMRSSSTAPHTTTSCRRCGPSRCTTGPRTRPTRSAISRSPSTARRCKPASTAASNIRSWVWCEHWAFCCSSPSGSSYPRGGGVFRYALASKLARYLMRILPDSLERSAHAFFSASVA